MAQSYDASGDILNDGQNQYLYDGEGRICAVKSEPVGSTYTMTGYIYDADGARVAKGTITNWSGGCNPDLNGFQPTSDYILGPRGEQAAEMSMGGTTSSGAATSGMVWQHTNVYAAGALIATYDNDGLHFYFNDPLGSRRAQTDYAGVLEQTCSSLPFGDQLTCTGSVTNPTEHHFTGKERDSESGNDYFEARYYGSSMGRMLSPDLLGGSLANPQSLNKYAYALNNPLVVTDPTGLYACKDDAKDATEHCTSDQDKSFEAARQRDLKLGGDAGRAAGAYGDPGAVNGVSVGFADLGKSGEDGKVVSSLGTDANGNLQAQSDVTINSKASGSALDAAVGHEGSHVADAQDVVKSIVVDPTTGNFTVGNNITRYQSEQRAYGVTNQILAAEGARANMGCDGCVLGQGTMQGQVPGVVNRIMNTGTLYMSGGQHMGPKNQGGSVVNGIQQTPNATVPH